MVFSISIEGLPNMLVRGIELLFPRRRLPDTKMTIGLGIGLSYQFIRFVDTLTCPNES